MAKIIQFRTPNNKVSGKPVKQNGGTVNKRNEEKTITLSEEEYYEKMKEIFSVNPSSQNKPTGDAYETMNKIFNSRDRKLRDEQNELKLKRQAEEARRKTVSNQKKKEKARATQKKRKRNTRIGALLLAGALIGGTVKVGTALNSLSNEAHINKTLSEASKSIVTVLDTDSDYSGSIVYRNSKTSYNENTEEYTTIYSNQNIGYDIFKASSNLPSEYTQNIIYLTYNDMGAYSDNMDEVFGTLTRLASLNPDSSLAQEIGNSTSMSSYIKSKGYASVEDYTQAMKEDTCSKASAMEEAVSNYQANSTGRRNI
jgi:hypothetical protein